VFYFKNAHNPLNTLAGISPSHAVQVKNAIFPGQVHVIIALNRQADMGEQAQSDPSFYPGSVFYLRIKGFFRAAISAFYGK